MKKILSLMILSLCCGLLSAQTKVGGLVVDAGNQPLAGVAVLIEEAGIGTVTDDDGRYTISASPDDILTFSVLGYVTQTQKVGNRATIDVKLTEDAFGLESVVVVGYGTAKKSDLTTSISSIKPDELKTVKTGVAADALQGLAAGVMVSKNSFRPGGSSDIIIRGKGSLGNGGANNTPLYVIDGVMSTAGLDVIPTSDIESIEILKDAAAAAIYGSRASNGVILITTKSGKKGQVRVTFNANAGVQRLANKQNTLDAARFKELLDAGSGGTVLWDAEEQRMLAEGRSTDWQEEITRTGVYQNYNLGISGGSEKTQYYFGADYVNQTGIILNTGYSKINARFNMDSQLAKWLKMDLKFNVIHTESDNSNTDGVAGINSSDQGTLASAVASKPTAPVFNEDGSYYDNLNLRPNPVAAAKYFKNNFIQTRIIGSVGFEAEIIKNLKFKTENGGEIINNFSDIFQDSRMTGVYKNVNIADRSNGQQIYVQTENTLTYSLDIDGHRLAAVAGFSASVFNWRYTYAQVLDVSNITQGDNLGTGTPKTVSSDRVRSSLASFFGRVNYSFKDKYIVTASLRADGSSKFAPGHKWGLFPSGGIAWRIDKEEFCRDLSFLSNLKLRASIGVVGNQEISAYQSMAQVDAASGKYVDYIFGNELNIGATNSNLAQPDLTWEKSRQFDVGLDIGLFSNRVSLSMDYYDKYTYDLLYNVPLPRESGYNTALVNVGAMTNRGVELQLNTVNFDTKDFRWQTSFNFSFNSNKVDKLYKDLQRSGSLFVGQNIDVIYTKRFGGIWQLDEADIAKVYNAEPGDIKIVDRNRNNAIDDDDRTFVGQTTPQYFGGFSNTFFFKNFDLALFFTYAGGHMIYNEFAYLDTYQSSSNMSEAYYNNYWTPERPSNRYPRLGSASAPLYETEAVYQKGDYFRLKNIELGYSLPESLLRKIRLAGIRIYVSAQNVFTITDYTGFDVEATQANPYPACRSYIAGLNINF